MRLLDTIEYDITGSIDYSGAEEIVLLYIDLANRISKENLETLETWLKEKTRPTIVQEALSHVHNGPKEIREKYRDEIQEQHLFGTELLETVIAAEGAALICEKESPAVVFEYLASFFGEEYYTTLKSNLKKLFQKWSS